MNIFNENMTSTEARMLLFSIVEGKNEEERKSILDEYSDVARRIRKRESKEYQGWMTSF